MTLEQIKEYNITREEIDRINMYEDGLSDMDMGFNPETREYDLFAIEWDGMYGRHWEYFNTEEEREAALRRHDQRQIELLPMVRQQLAEEKEAAKKAAIEKGRRIAAHRRFIKEQKTIGGHCPELASLLAKMRTEHASK